MNKRIAFVTNHYLPVIGGIEQNIHKLCNLLDNSYDIDILVAAQKAPQLVLRDGRSNVIGMSKYDFARYDYSKYSAVFITNFSIMPHMIILFKFAIKKYSKTRLLLVPHGGMTLNWAQFGLVSKNIKKLYNKYLGLPLVRYRVDEIIAVSNWEEKEIRLLGLKNHLQTIRNGIDIMNTKNLKKEKYFLYLGRIAPIKNIENVLDIYKNLKQISEFSDFQLIVIGNYSQYPAYYEDLKKKISKEKIQNVMFKGEKRGSEKIKIISKAKALICVSHWESDPIVIKESFSAGTKVIINDKYGLKDFEYEPNALVYDNQISDLKIRTFINSDFQSSFVNTLNSWAIVAKQYEELFI